MKNIGEKRGQLGYIFDLRNSAKKAIDERDLDKFEKEIKEIYTVTGAMLTKISFERSEAIQAMHDEA